MDFFWCLVVSKLSIRKSKLSAEFFFSSHVCWKQLKDLRNTIFPCIWVDDEHTQKKNKPTHNRFICLEMSWSSLIIFALSTDNFSQSASRPVGRSVIIPSVRRLCRVVVNMHYQTCHVINRKLRDLNTMDITNYVYINFYHTSLVGPHFGRPDDIHTYHRWVANWCRCWAPWRNRNEAHKKKKKLKKNKYQIWIMREIN